MFRYGFIHHRLSQQRIIALVMTEFAVTYDVDNHIFLEFPTVIQSSLYHKTNRLRIIPVYMEYRCIHHFGDIGAIGSGTGVTYI